ncbi:helix-turn-helix domain-containing protein [Amycolatopsis anabasis]|uniref:helix-turn-helix domain-containing protein n=1 Tax=Amycolatopsis anabasis TaxID=1840409 RepID=UPI00131A9165|nr:helix-turn-helix domain-containing protein [Amycolatopsis anabasis]
MTNVPEETAAVVRLRPASFTSAALDGLTASVRELADAVRELAARSPRDPDALLTAEQVGELLSLPPRTLKDQAAAGVLPHRRFGKHYRFSREDIAEIVRLTGRAPRRRGGLRVA